MANTSPIDKLDKAISKILTEYADEVGATTDEIISKVVAKGAKALRETSSSTFNGKDYKKSWTSQLERKRLYTNGIIYSRTPGLPHLLEYGHVLRAGGRNVGNVKGREHIAPVAEKLVEDFEKELKKSL